MSVVLTMLLAAAVSAPSPRYAAVVQQYTRGETAAAVAALRGWPEPSVRRDVGDVAERSRACLASGGPGHLDCRPENLWPGFSLPSALMLHTDCARADVSLEIHDRAALRLAQAMSELPALADFAERWFEVRVRLARGRNEWVEARSWAEHGVASFPRSARLRLLLGVIDETLGSQRAARQLGGALSDDDPVQARRLALARKGRGHAEPGDDLARAREALRATLELEPDLDEARLRFARVSWWRGELSEARAQLRRVLARRPADPATEFLAQIFLGRVEEDSGQLALAVSCYQAAVAVRPRCQSARIALSHALLRLGDPAGARSELTAALRYGGARSQPDPYWTYLGPPPGSAERDLAELRREVTQ